MPSAFEQMLRDAFALHRQGKLGEAERIYQAVLQTDGDHFDALQLLGAMRQQQGRHEEAIGLLGRAIAINPRHADSHNNLGNALHALNRDDEAIASFEKAVAIRPAYADAYNNLAIVLNELNRHDEAMTACRRALAANPDFARAHFNLGNALGAIGRNEEAVASYRRAVALAPRDAEGHFRLGRALRRLHREEEAVASLERAIALRPGVAAAYNALGNALAALQRHEDAIAVYRRGLAINPDLPRMNFNLGAVLCNVGRLDEARACWRKVLSLDPEFGEARWALAIYEVPHLFNAGDVVEAARTSFARELAALDEWFDAGRLAEGYKAVASAQPFYLAYQEEPNRELLARYGSLGARLMKHWQDKAGLAPAPHAAGDKLRIGIASAQIRAHSVWHALVKGWVGHIDPGRFELHVFHLDPLQDEETAFARSHAAHFEHVTGTLRQAVATLLAHDLDVLIYPEVGMNALVAQLAALRLAPVQVAAWGHPETTGLPTIDYYLSAAAFEPPTATQNYTERLVTLPHLGCCYEAPPVEAVAPDLGKLGIAHDVPLLLCPGTPYKYAPQHDQIFVEIARRLGRCRLVFFTCFMPVLSERLRQRLVSAFARSRMNFDEFGVFVPWQPGPEFHGLMQRADVFLDPIGFSGFNTAMQAVACGLPIVTREGRFMRGRLASGILKRMGLSGFVTADEDAYIELAVKLVRDAAFRQQVKERIEASRHLLVNDVTPVRALEKFLLTACGRS